jgi:hypothetical protein
MNAALEPKLAAPGAGLPKVELFIARAIFSWLGRKATREGVNAKFQKERDAIRALVRSIDADAAARRVLIRRVIGMEDSSRYWSVWMTLEHLRLVHDTVNGVIRTLANGALPPGKVNTANVKPKPNVTAAVVTEFEKSCDDLLATVAAAPNLKTAMRHEHPWFGPLDAAGWHTLAAGHLGIHREQIERIIKGLAATKP